MKLRVLVISSALWLCACGTTYNSPKSDIHPDWLGDTGIVLIPSSIDINKEMISPHETVLTAQFKHKRTARLGHPVKFTSGVALLENTSFETLEAGTPLFAVQFDYISVKKDAYGNVMHRYRQPDRLNSIEWCTPNPFRPGPICIFYENEDHAFLIEDTRQSSMYPTIDRRVGDRVDRPDIILADDVTFGKDLTFKLVLSDVDANLITFTAVFGSLEEGNFRAGHTAQLDFDVSSASIQDIFLADFAIVFETFRSDSGEVENIRVISVKEQSRKI